MGQTLMKPNLDHRIRTLERAILDEPNNANLYVELARCYSSGDELAQAVRHLEAAKKVDPYHVQASFELGVAYSRQANFDNAIREWEKMVDQDGDLDLDSPEKTRFSAIRAAAEAWRLYRQNREDNVFKFYHLGIAAMVLGGLDDACKAFETVVNMNPAFEKAFYYLARVQHKRKDNRTAIDCIQRFLHNRPRDPHGHYFYGALLLEEGRTAQAIEAFRKTFVDRPRHTKAHLQIASAYVNLMQFEEAIKHLDTVLKVDPQSARGHFLMGRCFEKLFQMDEAIKAYCAAVQADPDFKDAHFALGLLYRAVAEHEKALSHFKTTLELDPNESEAHYYTGMVLLALRRFDEAIKPLLNACKLSPGNAFAFYALGKACIGSGKLDKAVECFRRGLEINPRDTKARSALGQAFFQKNELTLAKRQFEKVLEENPREREARYFLGMCQFRLHEYDEAVESYRLAADVNPNSAIGNFTKGAIMASKNRYKEALECYRKASSYSPDNESDLEVFSTLQLLATVGISNALEGIKLQKFAQKQEELFESFVIVLSRLLDARDPYTKYHSQRVAHIGYVLATDGIDWAIANGKLPPSARLSPKTQKGIWVGGLLHDIGKIGIRDEVLNKPGKLTDEEYAQIKEHPTIGYEGLKRVPFIWDEVLPIVRFHHEKWNGHGYPTGRAGDDIPFEAQIIGVADFFDALTTQRPYRKAFSSRKALDIMIEEKGTFFNPALVEAFEGIIELVEAVPEAPLDDSGSYIFDKDQDVFDGLKMSWNYSA
jgi:HD-GYP domain-containing protein (c-di-GMP phosphodiesterase class II)/DNA-binding SARP family transcriptional activator